MPDDDVTEWLGTDTEAGTGEDTLAADDGEIVISIDGEETDADEDTLDPEIGEKGVNAIKAARIAAKEARAEAREAKAKLADYEAKVAKPVLELKRPTLEECEFNEDTFAARMADFVVGQRNVDAKKAEAAAAAKASETAYSEKLTRYHSERGKIGVDDDAQSRVVSALNEGQQTALMDASLDPAKVVAALAKTPKVLAELAGIKEIHRFTYRLAQIEGKIQMTTKAPPPPETRLRGGTSGGLGTLASQLDAAESKAEASGDRTEVLRLKRAMRDAGVAA